MKILYRKHKGSDTWHWCTNCKNWPDKWAIYEEKPVDGEPESLKLCLICKRYDDEGTCEKR